MTYTTAENEILVRKLGAEESTVLLKEDAGLDSGMLLLRTGPESVLLYERRAAGKTELAALYGDGRQELVCQDLIHFAGMRTDHDVLFTTSRDDGTSELATYDLESGERRSLHSAAAILPVASPDASLTAFVATARAEQPAEPFDHVLCRIGDTGKLEQLVTAPVGYGFGQASQVGEDLVYSVVRLGGEEYGRIVRRSGTGRETTLAEHAAVVDMTPDGGLLLLERGAPQSPPEPGTADTRTPDGAPGSQEPSVLEYLAWGGSEGRDIAEIAGDVLHGRICGGTALYSTYEDGEHALIAADLRSGKRRTLLAGPHTAVREIQPLDDKAALCVIDTLGSDGLAQESVLAFVPLDGDSIVEIDKSSSGFIHMAKPQYCEG